ncbi:hypothetical protein D3C78_1796270 [compost metagenome]
MRIEVLRVDDGAVDVGEDLEFIGAANIVAVARCAVRNDFLAVNLLDLLIHEWLDHGLFFGHATDPLVGFDAHLVVFQGA